MLAVGSVNAGLGQENAVLGEARATVVVPPGGVAAPLTAPGVAAALGMDGYSLEVQVSHLHWLGETSPEPLRHGDMSVGGQAAEPSHPARSFSP